MNGPKWRKRVVRSDTATLNLVIYATALYARTQVPRCPPRSSTTQRAGSGAPTKENPSVTR